MALAADNMNKKYDAVLFDFDGTVADTGPGIFNGIYHVLDFMGIDRPDPEKLRFFIGPPLQDGFKTVFGLDETQSNAAVAKYREHYAAGGMFELVFYDGMVELFHKIKEQNIKMGICSAKPEIFLKQIVEHFEMNDLFDAVVGNEPHYTSSDKSTLINHAIELMSLPKDTRVIMVGDRHFDINAAKKVGIDSVGVLFGYGSREEFEDAGADYMVEKALDIFEIVAQQ